MMTVIELKKQLNNIPDNLTVCVFFKGEVADILEVQMFEQELELSCGWVGRDEDGI